MKKIFFNHIPKTAGTTLYEYLGRFYNEDEIHPKSAMGGYESITEFNEEISDKTRFIASHKNIRNHLDDSWDVITFVRNPRDRLFSLYNHWISFTDEEIDNAPIEDDLKNIKKLIKKMSLQEILKMEDPLIKFHFKNGMAKNLIPITEHADVINDDEKLLNEAKKYIDKMSFVGLVERFKESQLLFEYKFNLPHERHVQSLNSRSYEFNPTHDENEEIEKAIYIDRQVYEYAEKKFNESLKIMMIKEVNLRSEQDVDLKLFFLHLMKTGGTSLIDILKEKFNPIDVVPERYQLIINCRVGNLNPDLLNDLEKLRNLKLYKEKLERIELSLPDKSSIENLNFETIFNEFKFCADHTTFHTFLPKNWKVITMLRDPKNRVLSHLNDLKNVSHEDIENIPQTTVDKKSLMIKIKSLSLDEIIGLNNQWINQDLINNQTKFLAGFFGRRKDFFTKTDDELLEMAQKNLEGFFAVGINERFFESAVLFHYKTKLPFDGVIPKLNSRGQYEKEDVTDEALEKVINLDQIIYKKAKEIFYKQYFEMLEDFVQSNFKNNLVEKKEVLMMTDNFIGTGWHQREGFDIGNVYRWTGPNLSSSVDLPFFNYQIESGSLHIISAMKYEIVFETKIFINDKEVETAVEELGNGHFIIKFTHNAFSDDFAKIRIDVPYVISHEEIGVDANDTRKKGVAVSRIDFNLNDFRYHNKPLLLCHSLGTECGIATYTEMLSESNGLFTLKNISEIKNEIPSHLHLQHEFGIVTSNQMKDIISFCNYNNVKLYVTMHTVLPKRMNFFSYVLTHINFILKYDSVLEILKKIKDKFWNILNFKSRNDGMWRPGNIVDSWEFFKSQDLIFKNSDKIFVHSESAKAELISQGVKNVELFIHPSIIFDTSKELYSQKDDFTHLGFFGFFNRDKNIHDLVKICKKIDKCKLHLFSCVKSDHDKDYFDLVINEIGDSENIVWHKEFIPLDKVIFELSKCDTLIWNSKPIAHFSSSGSVRQYLAAQRPIIARKNNLVEDVKDIVNVVDDLDVETLQLELGRMNYDSGKIRDYLEKYSWKNSKVKYD